MITAGSHCLRIPENCSFSPSDWRVLANYWHPVCLSADLTTDKPRAVVLLDEELVLYRAGETVVAARDL
jgi:phenylpropionate dioxygenase-like ring-hydroxylating dioxygenase large terminal subunit